jgi:hypothetical protein
VLQDRGRGIKVLEVGQIVQLFAKAIEVLLMNTRARAIRLVAKSSFFKSCICIDVHRCNQRCVKISLWNVKEVMKW